MMASMMRASPSVQQEEERREASGMEEEEEENAREEDFEARVGFVYASPWVRVSGGGKREKMGHLGEEKEGGTMREILRQSGLRIGFRAVVATPSRFGELLNDGCQIIHYVGHGDGECLSFESDNDRQCGIMERLEVNALKDLFQSKHARTKLVVVSSCCSESSGNAFVKAGVPHVIAVKAGESVSDEVAHSFAQSFYRALLGPQRLNVQDAFDSAATIASIGRNAGNSQGQGAPFILLPPGGKHDVQIFAQVPTGDFVEETLPLTKVYPCLPRARDRYLGIEALQKTLWPLLNPLVACVTVVGERGSGKTTAVIQACKFLRERGKFDAMFFAHKIMERADAFPSSGRTPVQDPCWLIGRALRMEPPPSSVEQLADFLFEQKEGRPPPCTVLLVVDGVDARDQDARDRFLNFMNSLCSGRDSYKLKLLVTSNVRLQHDSPTCFISGNETVLDVEPLKGTDPAQLFFNAAPRKLTRRELGVPPGCSHDEVLKALLGHLGEAKGHPGTLVLLASKLYEGDLNSPSFAAKAASLWETFHPAPMPASMAPTFRGDSRSISGDYGLGGGNGRGLGEGGVGQRPLPNDGGARGASTHGPGGRRHQNPPRCLQHDPRRPPYHQQQQQRQHYHQHQLTQQEWQTPHEYEYFEMCPDPQGARGTVSTADLNDPGCFVVWVKAIENAKADDRRYGSGGRPMAGGANCGRTDLVPLKYLSDGLQELLHKQQTTSSNYCHTGDDGRYECLADGTVDFGELGTSDNIDAPTPRSVYEEEMFSVKKRLLREQEIVAFRRMGPRARARELDEDDDDQHSISIEAFVRFSEWWAPVMATLSRLRDDWSSTDLVRVHWFMDRSAALDMLSQTKEGTFLLRFSETVLGGLVISVMEQEPSMEASTGSRRDPPRLRVKNSLLKVDERGQCHNVYEGRIFCSFTSLHDLVLKCDSMQTLYPGIPKEEAFREVPP